MKQKIFQTNDLWTPLILRIFLGLVVFPHGAQKLLGWFGGYGFSGTMSFFTGTVGLPWAMGLLVILLESVGAVVLMAGIATRLIVINYILLAIGIVFSSHIENGFFMNWFGNQAGEGYEYFLLWIGLATGLAISGGGKFSVDKEIIMKNKPALVPSKV